MKPIPNRRLVRAFACFLLVCGAWVPAPTAAQDNRPPEILGVQPAPVPVAPGAPITVQLDVTDPDGSDTVEVRVTWGDGNQSAWGTPRSLTHTYAAAGHYDVFCEARDAGGATAFRAIKLRVVAPVAGPRPVQSSSLAFDPTRNCLWVANPDTDTVARFDLATSSVTGEFSVSADPRSVAIDGAGRVWVSCHDAGTIDLLDGQSGGRLAQINLGYGSAPHGLLIARDGAAAYAALFGAGAIAKIDPATLSVARLNVGPTPRALALSGDGQRLLATRFVSAGHAEVWDIAAQPFTLTRVIPIGLRTAEDTTADGRGLPNYLSGIAISPDHRWAWVTAKKDNVTRGPLFYDGRHDLDSDNSVRTALLVINLQTHTEEPERGRDFDNADSPSAVAFNQSGDHAFITLQGNNRVALLDALVSDTAAPPSLIGQWETGAAPQGILVAPGDHLLAVQDFLGRSVTWYSLDGFLTTGTLSNDRSSAATVARETLAPDVLAGKRIFYHASDLRMSAEGYISCATCHIDGAHDGQTWDFTGRGEGLRNTIDLRGRAGTAHGPVHWSANFDEIQDFENDMRNAFGGLGFLSNEDFAATQNTLGAPKAGKNPELDALAAYVTSLGLESLPASPHRQPNGRLTPAASRGQALFNTLDCARCHAPATQFAQNQRHNVGTLRSSSGQRLGAALDGIDTPTLLGLWDGAPYFHDGSAPTLDAVFDSAGGVILPAESAQLSGGATAVTDQIDTLHGNSSYGGFVELAGNGARLSFSALASTTNGEARLELRYATRAPSAASRLTITINGADFELPLESVPTPYEWRTASLDRVPWLLTNAISLTLDTPGAVRIDQVVVADPALLAQAQPHRIVQTLNADQRADLVAFLLQLDGRDGTGRVTGHFGSVSALDFDGDGTTDLVARNGGTVQFAAGPTFSNWWGLSNLVLFPGQRAVAAGDLNQDGAPDLVVAESDRLWWSRGPAFLTLDPAPTPLTRPSAIFIGNIDQSVEPELLVRSRNAVSRWFLSNGTFVARNEPLVLPKKLGKWVGSAAGYPVFQRGKRVVTADPVTGTTNTALVAAIPRGRVAALRPHPTEPGYEVIVQKGRRLATASGTNVVLPARLRTLGPTHAP